MHTIVMEGGPQDSCHRALDLGYFMLRGDITMTPKDKPAMTEFSTETAASSISPMSPAKVRVIAPKEYWQMAVKIAGPAMFHNSFDSLPNSWNGERYKGRWCLNGGSNTSMLTNLFWAKHPPL